MSETRRANQQKLLVKPVPSQLNLNIGDDAAFLEYIEMARRNGIGGSGFHNFAIPRFLQREEIPIYSFDQVANYLDRLASKEGETWSWVPLRQIDHKNRWGNGKTGNGGIAKPDHPYQWLIPVDVVRLVDKLAMTFPQIGFYVSDYDVPEPDPFLMVTALGHVQDLIIASWDEPGFRMSK